MVPRAILYFTGEGIEDEEDYEEEEEDDDDEEEDGDSDTNAGGKNQEQCKQQWGGIPFRSRVGANLLYFFSGAFV